MPREFGIICEIKLMQIPYPSQAAEHKILTIVEKIGISL